LEFTAIDYLTSTVIDYTKLLGSDYLTLTISIMQFASIDYEFTFIDYLQFTGID